MLCSLYFILGPESPFGVPVRDMRAFNVAKSDNVNKLDSVWFLVNRRVKEELKKLCSDNISKHGSRVDF